MKSKYWIPVGLATIGLYLLFKDKLPFGKKQQPIKPDGTLTESTSSSGGSRPSKPSSSSTSTATVPSGSAWADVKTYIVNTATTPLNLRSTPSTSLAPIGSYPKGTEILAMPSGVSGWSAVVKKGGSFPEVIGYVNSTYLLPK